MDPRPMTADLLMPTKTIRFITWNVNGLREQREQKLTELRDIDVVFLQETHIGEGDDHIIECIKDEWQIFFTKYTTSQKGTAILVMKTLDFECISVEKDNCGGYVVLKCKLKGQLYTLVSVYNHQTDTETLEKLSRYLQSMTTGLLVIGGDFNTVLNPFIDKNSKTNKVKNNRIHHKLFSCVKKFMTSLQLVDIWRRKHPVKQNYTFHRGNVSSRLDYFFTPEECMWRVTSCDIRALERPDHQPLVLKICNISTNTSQKNLQIQSHFQLLSHKNHLGIEMTASSLVQESELSEVDIVSAVHSLQVSDTPRPDGIPASFYKENIQVVIPYIKMLYNRILSGTFNCSERRFNESVRSPHDNSQHFFNVNYILIATILARRLEDFLESQSEGRIPKESVTVLITPKTLHTQTVLGYIREELDRQRQSNPNLFQDFRAAENLVGNVEDTSVPCQGCPLTPVLITLALKCYASQLFQHLEKHLFIFKQSAIVCFLHENLNKVLKNRTDEEYNILILPKDNYEPLLLISLDSESEDWDTWMDGVEENLPERDESVPATCKIRSAMYAVITFQDTNEVMVAASNWLNTDKTQCHWPPFKSAEKSVQAVRDRTEPSTAGKQWEMLNIILHAEYDTYAAAKKKQEEQEAQKDGMYAVVTLQESNELTVIPTNWLNEQKTQCHWPSLKSPKMCTEAVKKRFQPARGEIAWEMLQIYFHEEHASYDQAVEREALIEESKKPSTSFGSLENQNPPLLPSLSTLSGMSTDGASTPTSHGIKRKREESPDIKVQSHLATDMDIMKEAEQIIGRVNEKVQAIKSTDCTMTTLKTYIVDAISKIEKMDKDRKKETIGIFGRTGEGKSSLLNAVLGEQFLLPSGGFGACTAVITQVEANLNDSNYIAEIELISKEEWENEMASNENEDGGTEMSETIKERIIAVFGADAEEKTLEELKRDDRYTEINNVLSTKTTTISNQNMSEFTNDVKQYIKNCVAQPGGWYWPLVNCVTIKVPNCHDLLEHIVLVDIPGTGDCDKIRDDLWKTKLKDCSSVWIVSNINRAVSERDPWELLEHCIQDLRGGGECKHINFICTKTDDINPEEHLEKICVTNEEKKSKRQKSILVRNNDAKKELRRKLQKSQNEDSKKRFITDVFTVSSKEFFNKSPVLEATETEIPELQNVLRSINKNINQKLTSAYVNEAKGVLYLIQQDTKKKMAQAKGRALKDLKQDLEEALDVALKKLNYRVVSLYGVLEECLSKGEKESVRLCVQTTHDMLSSVRPKNNKGFHKVYRAMCVKRGYHWPKNSEKPINLNKYLTKHMYDNIDEQFNLIFSVEDSDKKDKKKTEKSMQDMLDTFSIIKDVSHIPSWQQHIIKTKENKLKASLSRHIIETKKEIYSSIQKNIQRKMTPGYKKAAEVKGHNSMKRMERKVTETIEELKPLMFNEAKVEVMAMFKKLKEQIMETLESGLKSSMDNLLSKTSKTPLLDVSREFLELEELSKQLSACCQAEQHKTTRVKESF